MYGLGQPVIGQPSTPVFKYQMSRAEYEPSQIRELSVFFNVKSGCRLVIYSLITYLHNEVSFLKGKITFVFNEIIMIKLDCDIDIWRLVFLPTTKRRRDMRFG